MSTSCGGGYCDCGDSEAWSDFVHCTAHSVGAGGGLASAVNEDPVEPLILFSAFHDFLANTLMLMQSYPRASMLF